MRYFSTTTPKSFIYAILESGTSYPLPGVVICELAEVLGLPIALVRDVYTDAIANVDISKHEGRLTPAEFRALSCGIRAMCRFMTYVTDGYDTDPSGCVFSSETVVVSDLNDGMTLTLTFIIEN